MEKNPELIPGNVLDDQVVAAGGHYAREMHKGEVLRIVNIEGQQCADFVCFNLHKPMERLSPENTVNFNKQVYPRVGYALFSDEASKLVTIIADTCGVHDMLAGACSSYSNQYRYGVPGTPNCRDNLSIAVKPWGLDWKDVPYPMNVFMNTPIGPDGTFTIQEPKARPGDYIDFQAEMDILAAFSNCPQVLNPCNAYKAKTLRVIHYKPE